LRRSYPIETQERFGKEVAAALGFDFRRGRLDTTAHPFCSGLGPYDCRITTRYDEHFFPGAFFGILHESGHGLYDQGLRTEFYGLPPGEAISLGIHESQSRLWENQVGRGRAFWSRYYARAQELFPQALGNVALDDFYFAINDVEPSLIRVEADEVTYNLHILARFEMELELINDDLPVTDLPEVWSQKYASYLGIRPPQDADGVLQDIHWSAGLIGYFATYSLGNLYAAQFYRAADEQLGGLDRTIAMGDFGPLLEWLRENIHRRGQCLTAAELVQDVTGTPLGHEAFMSYLTGKFGPLFATQG
jgi:carboxypeptidase Taq